MNIFKKIAFAAMFFAMSFFIVIGYAAVTDQLTITGEASFTPPPPSGLFIIDVSFENASNITHQSVEYANPTTVRSSVIADSPGNIIYKITVENNSNTTYWYRGIVFDKELKDYRNNLIGSGITVITKNNYTDSQETFSTDSFVPPNVVREFYAIYNFSSNAAVGELATLIDFSFGGKIESYGDEVLSILNDPKKYELLAQAFDDAYEKNGTTILGNVGGDEGLLGALFGTDMIWNNQPVTVMIQRDNVDYNPDPYNNNTSNKDGLDSGDSYSNPNGPKGCEYTIYITSEDPTTGNPTVYAISYTTQEDGTWRQIGALYEGTVEIGTYTDSNGEKHTSIDVTSWTATEKTYTIFSYGDKTVEYIVGAVNQGDQYDKYKTINQLMGGHDQDLYNDLNRASIVKAAYWVLEQNPTSQDPEIVLLREAFARISKYYVKENQDDFVMIQSWEWTRAEVISAFEALGQAMEYYQQIRGPIQNP